jgi:hypothetical protein
MPCVYTYWAEGYRGRSESYETAVAGVGLVDGIGVLLTQLANDPGYPVVVLGSECVPDEAFEFEGAALALVVELVVERFSDIGVHSEEVECTTTLHGAAAGGSHRACTAGRGRFGRWWWWW